MTEVLDAPWVTMRHRTIDGAGSLRRSVATALVARISGLLQVWEALEARDAIERMRTCFGSLAELVTRAGGDFEVQMDDWLLAIFRCGAQPEDSQRAALQAATTISEQALGGGTGPERLVASVGVESGFVIGAPSPREQRRSALIGEPITIARRLSVLAPPGRIYVGAALHAATSGDFDYAAIPHLAGETVYALTPPRLVRFPTSA